MGRRIIVSLYHREGLDWILNSIYVIDKPLFDQPTPSKEWSHLKHMHCCFVLLLD